MNFKTNSICTISHMNVLISTIDTFNVIQPPISRRTIGAGAWDSIGGVDKNLILLNSSHQQLIELHIQIHQ